MNAKDADGVVHIRSRVDASQTWCCERVSLEHRSTDSPVTCDICNQRPAQPPVLSRQPAVGQCRKLAVCERIDGHEGACMYFPGRGRP